jgi:non-specific serine/threonine protein kinase
VRAGGGARQPARSGRTAHRRLAQPLSPREQEVAALIVQGRTDREIAAVLVLSEHTVHAHVRNLLAKLGLASRTQIAAWVATRAPDEQAEL